MKDIVFGMGIRWFFSALVLAVFATVLSCGKPKGIEEPEEVILAQSNYQSLQDKVFTPKCARCHSGPQAVHGVRCDSFENLRSSAVFPPLIVPGDPESSSLYKVIKNGSMPKKGRHLPKNVVQAIYDWIKKGANKIETEPQPTPTPTGVGCEPGEPGCSDEPCDQTRLTNEPGFNACEN